MSINEHKNVSDKLKVGRVVIVRINMIISYHPEFKTKDCVIIMDEDRQLYYYLTEPSLANKTTKRVHPGQIVLFAPYLNSEQIAHIIVFDNIAKFDEKEQPFRGDQQLTCATEEYYIYVNRPLYTKTISLPLNFINRLKKHRDALIYPFVRSDGYYFTHLFNNELRLYHITSKYREIFECYDEMSALYRKLRKKSKQKADFDKHPINIVEIAEFIVGELNSISVYVQNIDFEQMISSFNLSIEADIQRRYGRDQDDEITLYYQMAGNESVDNYVKSLVQLPDPNFEGYFTAYSYSVPDYKIRMLRDTAINQIKVKYNKHKHIESILNDTIRFNKLCAEYRSYIQLGEELQALKIQILEHERELDKYFPYKIFDEYIPLVCPQEIEGLIKNVRFINKNQYVENIKK